MDLVTCFQTDHVISEILGESASVFLVKMNGGIRPQLQMLDHWRRDGVAHIGGFQVVGIVSQPAFPASGNGVRKEARFLAGPSVSVIGLIIAAPAGGIITSR